MDLISLVPNLSSANKETDMKEEEDPLLITFQDLQEKNEVCTYVQLSTFHNNVRECIWFQSWPSLCVCCCVDNWRIIYLELIPSRISHTECWFWIALNSMSQEGTSYLFTSIYTHVISLLVLRLILVMSVLPLCILNVMYLSLNAVCTVVTSVIQNVFIFAVCSAQGKFHNLELHELYFSLSITRMIKWIGGAMACMGQERNG